MNLPRADDSVSALVAPGRCKPRHPCRSRFHVGPLLLRHMRRIDRRIHREPLSGFFAISDVNAMFIQFLGQAQPERFVRGIRHRGSQLTVPIPEQVAHRFRDELTHSSARLRYPSAFTSAPQWRFPSEHHLNRRAAAQFEPKGFPRAHWWANLDGTVSSFWGPNDAEPYSDDLRERVIEAVEAGKIRNA
jgi:hypothetical protein